MSYHCACPLAFTGKDCGTGEGAKGSPGVESFWEAGRAAVDPRLGWGGGGPAWVLWEHCVTHREML